MGLAIRTFLHSCAIALLALSGCVLTQASHADEAPTRLIVKWKDRAAWTHAQSLQLTRERFAARTGHTLQLRRTLDDRLDVMQLEQPLSGDALAETLAQLQNDSRVEYAVVDQRRYAHALTNDPLITATSGRSGQWYLLNTQPSSINAFDAWDVSTGNGVIVAVLDTGVRLDHPDLVGKLLPGYDFVSCDQSNCSGTSLTYLTANDGNGWDADPSDPGDWLSSSDMQNHSDIFPSTRCSTGNSSWHGTRVAGIIGAATNNGIGIAGIGYNTRILPVRVLGKCGGYDSDIIAGMKWAAGMAVSGVPPNPNPAKVINLSLGSADPCTQAYQDAINQIIVSGHSIVASAGNEGGTIDTPANCNGVISVVGVRNVGSKVGYSNLGNATIAAPAGNCINTSGACLFPIDTTTNLGTTTPLAYNPGDTTTYYTDQTNYNLGTSFSAPIVSGTLALMLGRNPTLLPIQMQARLQASAKPFPSVSGVSACHIPTGSNDVQNAECNCTRATCGAGLTNAYNAVLGATQPVVPYIRGAIAASTGRTITLDAGGSTFNDNQASYIWSVQSGNPTLSSTTGGSITVTTPNTAGAINLLLNIDDGAGNTGSINHTINVYGPPTASITGSGNVVTVGQSVTMDGSASHAQDGGYISYTWATSNGTLSSSNGTSTTLTASTAGIATITLTVTDQEGASASQSLAVTVKGTSSSSSSSSAASSSSVSSSSNSSSHSGGGYVDALLLVMLTGLLGMQVRHT